MAVFVDVTSPTTCFFRTLPESPPDSSSEPYSPQQVNGEWQLFSYLPLRHNVTKNKRDHATNTKRLFLLETESEEDTEVFTCKSISVTHHIIVLEHEGDQFLCKPINAEWICQFLINDLHIAIVGHCVSVSLWCHDCNKRSTSRPKTFRAEIQPGLLSRIQSWQFVGEGLNFDKTQFTILMHQPAALCLFENVISWNRIEILRD